MNVVIVNRQKDKLSNLNIEVIKRLDGEFEADEIISSFQNIFYNKMILDITALKNYQDINTIQKLSISLDMEKLILLLEDGQQTTMPSFLSKLISIGIYNFTTTLEGILYLYNNPNTYRDVAQYHHIIEPETVVKTVAGPVQGQTMYVEKLVSSRAKVLGIKSVTKEAGATTLTYMIKKALEKNYSVLGIEVDKTDFSYFKENGLLSVSSNNLGGIINQNSDKNVIILDINNSTVAEGLCDDIIYLLEPSTIKLNKLITLRPNVLKELKGKKIVLVKSTLDGRDINDFSMESNLDVFFNLPTLDERKNNEVILELLKKLNIV